MKRAFKNLFIFTLLLSSLNFLAYGQENSGKSALIIIDMQPYFANRGGHAKDKENKEKIEEILNEQVEAIEEARKANIPIVFIEYDLSGWATKGAKTNKRLLKAAKGYKNQISFLKNTDGMFSDYNKSKEDIIDYLDTNGVKNLIITGANGGACVESSITGAMSLKKYNVYGYSKGIADFNYSEFIYPYDDQYNFIKSNETCSFKELDYMQEVIDVINFSADEVATPKVVDIDRSFGTEKPRKQNKQRQQYEPSQVMQM